jgi:hypothetical protein
MVVNGFLQPEGLGNSKRDYKWFPVRAIMYINRSQRFFSALDVGIYPLVHQLYMGIYHLVI